MIRALALASLIAGSAGCTSRPHVGAEHDKQRDAGRPPSVVMVDRAPPPRPVRGAAKDLALIDEKEPDDDLQHAQPLELPKGVRGTIGPPIGSGKSVRGDEDHYQWMPGGDGKQVARIELFGVPGLTLALEVLDGDGQKVTVATDAGEGEPQVIPNLTVATGKTCYLRVRAIAKKGQAPPSSITPYRLVVLPAPVAAGEEEEPNDTADHASRMAGADSSGFHGRRRDEDWLRLPTEGVPPGSTLRIELGAVEGVAQALRIVDGAGQLFAEARGGRGEELRLRNAPLPAGALCALRADSGYSTEARWTLRTAVEAALEGAEIEPNDRAASATPVSSAVPSVSGFLWPGDADLFRFHVDAPSLVSVEIEPPDGVDAKLEWIVGALPPTGSRSSERSVDDKPRAKSDEGGAGKAEALPPLALPGGDLVVRVTARPRDAAFDAPYKLTFTSVLDDGATEHEQGNTPAQVTPLTPARAMQGFLFPRGDEDWYRITAPDGAATLHATLEGGPKGIALKVTDEARVPLGPAAGLTASGPIQPGKSYLVQVRDPAGKATSAREAYRLTVRFE
ncbi:MAG: hypothetical protein EXR72_07635 [Myxococcales bacterium]|nr:hypothetical protein [Myxococcales bacterium]